MITNKLNQMNIQTFGRQALILLLISGLFFTSCKKDKDKVDNPSNQTKKLIKLEEDASNYFTFEYNADGTLKMMKTVDDAGGTAESTVVSYSYDPQKKISESTIDGAVTLKYLYSGNKIDKVEFYSENIKALYYEFQYSGTQLTKILRYTNMGEDEDDFVLSGKSECAYFANGNFKEVKDFNSLANNTFELTFSREYADYDSKINPFKPLSEANFGLIPNFASPNNLLKEKLLKSDGTVESESVYTYTYGAAGYPLTGVKKTTQQGVVNTSNLKFVYQ